jgi:hypothetical protein
VGCEVPARWGRGQAYSAAVANWEPVPPTWVPLNSFPEIRDAMKGKVPGDAWGRVLPDEARGGFPAFVSEAFWITNPVFHVLRVDGFTLDVGGPDDTATPAVVGHEKIRFDTVTGYDREAGTIALADGRTIDVPVALVDAQLLGEGQARGW